MRLTDIAARARVSVATVSMALRDDKLISEATRTRIVALARQMGYQRHPYVSAYMSWRRNRGPLRRPTVALLHNYAAADGWRTHGSVTLREMRRGVLEQLQTRGYASEEFSLRSARPGRLVDILAARGIEGLVFAPIPEKANRYDFPWDDFSTVQIGTGPTGLKLPRVAHDHYQSALEAVRRCAARAYRRPALVIDGAHDVRLEHVWRAGFEMGAEECGFERHHILQLSDAEPHAPALQRWLRRARPDVIVTNLHRHVEDLLRDLGRDVPADIGLVSLSVPALGDRVTGIDQHGYLIGTQAVDVLAAALQLHRTGVLTEAVTTLVAGRWNAGETF